MSVLFGTPIIRSLFIVGAFMFFSFGLWNVLLLPFSLQVLGATEFQYGLQEGLTSVGFVFGSFFMARFSSKLPEPAWIVLSMIGMGICGVLYGLSTQINVAIALVMISGFFNRRRRCRARCCSSGTRRARCAAGCSRRSTSCATSCSCSGWPAPAWPTSSTSGCSSWSRRRCCSSRRPSRSSPRASAVSTWGAASARLRGATAAPALGAATARAATIADFDRLAGRLGAFSRLSPDQRAAFVRAAKVVDVAEGHPGHPARRRRDVRVLHPRRLHHGRHPGRRRLRGPVDDDRRRLLRRDRGADRAASGRPTWWPTSTRRCSRSPPTRCGRRWSCPRSSTWSCPP